MLAAEILWTTPGHLKNARGHAFECVPTISGPTTEKLCKLNTSLSFVALVSLGAEQIHPHHCPRDTLHARSLFDFQYAGAIRRRRVTRLYLPLRCSSSSMHLFYSVHWYRRAQNDTTPILSPEISAVFQAPSNAIVLISSSVEIDTGLSAIEILSEPYYTFGIQYTSTNKLRRHSARLCR